jgi:hypothetical protein
MGRPAPGSLQPAHRDETAMNGAQLLIAHSDSSGLMNGPPAWLGFVVSTSQKRDVDHPPVHRDKAAMNGAQLLMAHGDSSGLMNGPPAIRGVARQRSTLIISGILIECFIIGLPIFLLSVWICGSR